jgi:hypothetical protein
MAFDINPQTGNIDLNPLFSWDWAVIADAGCALRLVFATRSDAPETNPIVVQASLSAEQARELAEDLLKMVTRIDDVRSRSTSH